jgi:hypothetical protein
MRPPTRLCRVLRKSRSLIPFRSSAGFRIALVAAVLSWTQGIALAQDTTAPETPPSEGLGTADNAPAEEEETAEPAPPEAKASEPASPPPPATAKAATKTGRVPMYEAAPGAPRCYEEPIHPGDHPEHRDHRCFESTLEWKGGFLAGGMEVDLGYARYEFEERDDLPYATLHDLRGRFVLGPVFRHPFGDSGYFFAATGQVVAWIREQSGEYQINADDVYAAIGKDGLWDFQIGRFMTWRVYHKGLGFDLYTLEDNGAAISTPIANASYGVHTYEVDYIYLRNSPYVGGEIAGRAALHLYPTRFLGFELAGVYGLAENKGFNTMGGRFAGDFHWKFIRASVGAEYRFQKRTEPYFIQEDPGPLPPGATPPPPTYIECPDCGVTDNKGVGGGLVVKYVPVEVGGGIAKGWDMAHLPTPKPRGGSNRDLTRTGTRMSYGGYVELDPGTLIFDRPLILGAGINWAESILDSFDQQFHVFQAAYIAFPLGFNDAMVKLVLSRAELEVFDSTDTEGSNYIKYNRSMTAARLRVSYKF